MKSVKLTYNQSTITQTSQIVNVATNNLIKTIFVKSPLFSKYGLEVGNFVSNVNVQQLAVNKFSFTVQSTYYLNGYGSFNWQYSFIRADQNYVYTPNVVIEAPIVSGTGKFLNSTGKIKINPTSDGNYYVVAKLSC